MASSSILLLRISNPKKFIPMLSFGRKPFATDFLRRTVGEFHWAAEQHRKVFHFHASFVCVSIFMLRSAQRTGQMVPSPQRRRLLSCPLSLPRTAVWMQLLSPGDGGLVVAQGGCDPGLDGAAYLVPRVLGVWHHVDTWFCSGRTPSQWVLGMTQDLERLGMMTLCRLRLGPLPDFLPGNLVQTSGALFSLHWGCCSLKCLLMPMFPSC